MRPKKLSNTDSDTLNTSIEEKIDLEVSPEPFTDQEEFNYLVNSIQECPYVHLIPFNPSDFGLSDTFLGKKHSFFGFVNIEVNYNIGNGTTRLIPLHQIFIAHLIDPPEIEGIYKNSNNDFTNWRNNRHSIKEYREYLEFYERLGFQEVIAHTHETLKQKIREIKHHIMGGGRKGLGPTI